jgi:hypothetical protein
MDRGAPVRERNATILVTMAFAAFVVAVIAIFLLR